MSLVKVFFNAVRTEYGSHLFAVGWSPSAGYTVSLAPESGTRNIIFMAKKPTGPAIQVITPFQICISVNNSAKSIMVLVGDEALQIQIMDMRGCCSGKNDPGEWATQSGK